MTSSTAQVIALTVNNDPSATPEEKQAIMDIINGKWLGDRKSSAAPLKHVVSREELAKLAHRSVKWVDRFVRDNPGVLERVKAPGAQRSIGFSYDSVERFLSGVSAAKQRKVA